MFKDLLEDYLKAENTDYAIVLNGEWGCGKTTYIRNLIKSEKTDSYQVVFVSLFGTTSIEDFYKRIFWSLHGIEKKFNKSVANRIFSSIDCSVGVNFGLLNLKLKKQGRPIDEKSVDELVNLVCGEKKRLYIFDDVERISYGDVNVAEIFGAITNLIDEDNAKVVLVCNEQKIKENKDDMAKVYFSYKEKFVRTTYPYNPIIELNGIENVYNSFANGNEFLLSKKEKVLGAFKKSERRNLRTLRFILDVIEYVYQKLKDLKFNGSESLIINHIIVFTVVYIIEYKDGKYKEYIDKLRSLPQKLPLDVYSEFNGADDLDKPDIYYKKLASRYSDLLSDYHYMESVANYIQTGILPSEQFRAEIQNLYENYVKHQQEDAVFQTVIKYSTVQDGEFKSALERVRTYIKEGKYQYGQLLNLYRLKLRFGDKYKLSYSEKDIKNALKALEGKAPYINSFGGFFKKEDSDTDYAFQYNKMLEVAESVNKKNFKYEKSRQDECFYEKIENNGRNALFLDYQKNNNLLYGKDIERVFRSLEKADNPTAYWVIYMITMNYSSDNSLPYNSAGIDDYKLIGLLKSYIENHPEQLRIVGMKELLTKLENAPIRNYTYCNREVEE